MFSILRESSGLTFIFINATKQYLKSWVSFFLFLCSFKESGDPHTRFLIPLPEDPVHNFPPLFLAVRKQTRSMSAEGIDSEDSSDREGVLLGGQ